MSATSSSVTHAGAQVTDQKPKNFAFGNANFGSISSVGDAPGLTVTQKLAKVQGPAPYQAKSPFSVQGQTKALVTRENEVKGSLDEYQKKPRALV